MNRIILIGNGFDLAHGLKTGYKDFIDWFWNRRAEDVQKSEEWRTNKNFSDKFISVTYKKNFDFSKLKDHCTYNSHFLERLTKESADNYWYDIEAIYFQRLKECKENFDKKKERHLAEVMKLNFDLDQIKNELIEYLICETEEKKLIEIEKDGTHKLNNDFEKDLQSQIKKIIFDFDYKNKDTQDIDYKEEKFKNGKILLLNFNYTKTAELYSEGKAIINYIHGELDHKQNNPIIFGYGDEKSDDSIAIEKLEEHEFLKNVKSLNYNITHNYTDLESFLQEPYEVFVFGHSCANCDRTLLNMLFDNDQNCTSIRIFYHSEDPESFKKLHTNIYLKFNAETKSRFRKVIKCKIDSIPLPSKKIVKIIEGNQQYILDYLLEKVQIPNENYEYTLLENSKKRIIKKSFYISKYQVTQKQYENITGKKPSYFKGADLPVELVSWFDAIEFCNELSARHQLGKYYNRNGDIVTFNTSANGFRLPTEAEWEYAARGGNLSENFEYSGSNQIKDVAWYYENSGNKELDEKDWNVNDLEKTNVAHMKLDN